MSIKHSVILFIVFQQLDTEKEKVRVLTEENALLEFEKKNRLKESTTLEQELEEAQARTSGKFC